MSLPMLPDDAQPAWDAQQKEEDSFSKICFIPSLSLSCFGCCGHHWKDKRTLHAFFDRNQKILDKYRSQGRSYQEFMNREQLVSSCGGCYSLVRDKDDNGKDRYVCGVHPLRIGEQPGPNGKDIRVGYCEHDYLCKSAAHVNKMTDEEKRFFYQFLKEQEFDAFEYSLINAQETVLLELYRIWKAKIERGEEGGRVSLP